MSTRTNNMTFTRKRSLAKIAIILEACKHGRTRQEIEIILSMERRTVLLYFIHLMDTEQVHISSWKREGIGQFYPVPVYKTGKGVNAIKPEPLSKEEKHKRAWAKLKADPIRFAQHRARKSKKPVQTAVKSPFNWRGPSQILSEKEWLHSVRVSEQTAGTGSDPRKQFIIKERP